MKSRILFALASFVLTASSGSHTQAQTTAKKRPQEAGISQPSSPTAINVSKYVEQLNHLSDSDVQSAADDLVSKLLAEFRHGAAIEQSRNKRAAYQRYRTELQADVKQCDADYQQLTKWLQDQKAQIERQAGKNAASTELARQRFELLVQRQSERALAIESKRESLKSQLTLIEERINDELTYEALKRDQQSSVTLPTGRDAPVVLPEEFINPEGSSSTGSLPLDSTPSKSMHRASKVALRSDAERSPSNLIDPKQAAAAKRLMEALIQSEKNK